MIPQHLQKLYIAALKYDFSLARMSEPGSQIKISAYDSISLSSFDCILNDDQDYYPRSPYFDHTTTMVFGQADSQRAIFGWWYRGNGRWERDSNHWGDEDD